VAGVSFHEEIISWNAYIARAKDQRGVVRGYGRLEKILTDSSVAQISPFDDAAADIFSELRAQKVRIGTMDLRIASIAVGDGNDSDSRRTPLCGHAFPASGTRAIP
jgi:tRNA(fMet)-specific endonuclease VapC